MPLEINALLRSDPKSTLDVRPGAFITSAILDYRPIFKMDRRRVTSTAEKREAKVKLLQQISTIRPASPASRAESYLNATIQWKLGTSLEGNRYEFARYRYLHFTEWPA